jgi:GAF domain-containing protein
MAARPGAPGGQSPAWAAADVRRTATEQAALRLVALLVARAVSPEEVFAAVAAEAGRLLSAGHVTLSRYDPDGAVTVVAAWSGTGAAIPVGTRMILGGRNVHTLVFQTGRAARVDDYAGVSGAAIEVAREFSIRAAVAAPVSVEGQLWGVMSVASTSGRPLPADTETRLATFTELAATAIANAQAREELGGFAEEQAALRRVAVLVARGAPPSEVFAAVAEEAGRLLGADFTGVARYDPDGTGTVLGAWSGTGSAVPVPVGTRAGLGGRDAGALVFQTGRSVRIDDYAAATGPVADLAREWGVRSSVGAPVSVEGRLWGVMSVASTRGPLPAGAEARLATFTELAATAIANAQARMELRDYAGEQAALRRVAVQVARGAPPSEVFAAIAAEAGRLLGADFTAMSRYDPDGAATFLAQWVRTGTAVPVALGTRFTPGGRNVHTMVFQTGRPARIDNYIGATGTAAEASQEWGLSAVVAVPISVGGQLWGVIGVGSRQEPLPANTEGRLADFADLASTAIVNAEAQDALAASRVRVVAAADQTRRRIERDLHDGAQQRLVSLALHLREAQSGAQAGAGELAAWLDDAVTEVTGVLEELREIARGLHPAALAEGGLRPALRALARRSAVPVDLDVQVTGRLPETAEVAAYYAAAEALTNTAKHAHASAVKVEVAARDGVVHLRVSDDGSGGADFGRGSGLVGLKDRVEALGGRILLDSPPGAGTVLDVVLPLGASSGQPAGSRPI